jgi:DME family drug/metabolite transporter
LSDLSSGTKTTTKDSRGYLICLTATAVWSFTAIFIRYLTDTYLLPPLVLAFWRDAFVSVALATVFLVFNRTNFRLARGNLKFMVLYGLILSSFNAMWTVSVGLNGAAVSTVLVYSSPAFTALLGWWLFSERVGVVKIIAVLLSLIGCVFISDAYDSSAWQVNTIGIITGLLSGLGFAAYSIMGKASAERSINPWTAMLYSFGFGAFFLLLYNLFPVNLPVVDSFRNLFWLDGAWMGWTVLVILAVGPTIGGYGLYTVSLSYLPVVVANLIATLEPVMTALLAYFLLGERFTIPQLLGSALIIAGVILLRVSGGRRASGGKGSPVFG